MDAAALWPNTENDISAELNAVQDMGIKWLRADFNWPSIERDRGRFEFHKADYMVQQATARGLKIMGEITSSPGWAGPNGMPTNPADYGNYAGALARRYAPLGVHTWEIWNEANLRGPWPGTPDPAKYTAMLKAAYTAIHAADPHATVVTSGLAPASDIGTYSLKPSTFLRRMYDNGAQGYFDAVGLHPHTTPYPSNIEQPWNPIVYARDEMYPLMRAHGDGAKKIWGTEAGFTTSSDTQKSVSESLQGPRLVLLIQTWSSYPWAGPIFLYQARDSGTDHANWHNNFGIMHTNWVHKPAYNTLRSFLR